jgi:YbbR domain-containing protein
MVVKMTENNQVKKTFKRISNNLTPKLISIAFAILFWFYVMDQVNPEITKEFVNIPVEIKGIEEIKEQGLYLLNNPEYKINVTLSGRRNDVIKISNDMIVLSADIRGYSSGINTVPIDKSVKSVDVSIFDMSSNELKIALDKFVSIQKKVTLEQTGIVMDGRIVTSLEYDNDYILVEGPESVTNRVNYLKGIIDITDKQESYTTAIQLVAMDVNDKQVTGVTIVKPEIEVKVGISSLQSFDVIPLFINTPIQNIGLESYTLSFDQVELKSLQNAPDFSTIHTKPIDLTNLTEDISIVVELDIPDGFEPIDPSKSSINVHIKTGEIQTKEFSFKISEMAFLNVNQFLESKVLSDIQEINLKVFATQLKLENIKKSDFELIINLEGLPEGQHEVPIQIIGLNDLTHEISIQNVVVELTLKND